MTVYGEWHGRARFHRSRLPGDTRTHRGGDDKPRRISACPLLLWYVTALYPEARDGGDWREDFGSWSLKLVVAWLYGLVYVVAFDLRDAAVFCITAGSDAQCHAGTQLSHAIRIWCKGGGPSSIRGAA